jgi:hypothetical protein
MAVQPYCRRCGFVFEGIVPHFLVCATCQEHTERSWVERQQGRRKCQECGRPTKAVGGVCTACRLAARSRNKTRVGTHGGQHAVFGPRPVDLDARIDRYQERATLRLPITSRLDRVDVDDRRD